jgi:peptidoglycan hydrolase-like protein with peptidoglycan-binding domain
MNFRSAAMIVLLSTAAFAPAVRAQDAGLLFIQPLTPEGVRAVQARLKAMAGYPGPVDGIWGPGSRLALRNFQQNRGLQATGEMNQATAATLGLDPVVLVASAAPPPPAPVPAPVFTISGDSMRIIQARLRQLGFYKGDVDATWGASSQTALQNFQAANGIAADGRLTRATVQALGIDPSTIQASQ